VAETFSILQTKLYRPPQRPFVISRPHLLARLDDQPAGRVTLLSAPAGFGKTTLVSEWASLKDEGGRRKTEKENSSFILHPSSFAWLSLDESDNDLARFWRYVIVALQQLSPTIGKSAEPLLANLKPAADIEPLMTALINDITAAAPPETTFTLALDDYHLIQAAPIHQSLSFLLQHQPPQLHILILTRADPPLSLARLRVQGRLLELRAADLRLTLAETESFLNEVMGLGLPLAAVQTLAARTEGWAAALQLAALSLRGLAENEVDHFVQTFAGTHRHILNYLLEEVLQRQPPAVQQFLLRTAVLRRLTAPLCQAVTAQPEAAAILAELARASLFVTSLDEAGQWYRYHPLFAEALQARLRQLEPGLLPELHRRASGWCASNGFWDKAIGHALAAEDYETAASLIEQQAEQTWAHGDLATVLGWLDALPAHLPARQPRLCLIYTWLLFLHDRWDKATACWQTAEQLISQAAETEQPYLRGMWAAIGGAMAAHRREAAETLRLTQEALVYLPPEETTWREVTLINLGLAYLWQGKAHEAIAACHEAAEWCRRQGNIYLAFAALWHEAEACLAAGRLRHAATLYEQLQRLDESEGSSHLLLKANGDVGLAGLAYEHNDLATAKALLTAALPQLWPGGQPRVVLYGRIVLARLYHAQGQHEAAQGQLRLAETMTRQMNMAAESRQLAAVCARLALNQGDENSAAHWLVGSPAAVNDRPDLGHEEEHLALAHLLLKQQRYGEARELLRRLQAAAEQDGRDGSLIEILILTALLHQAHGQHDQALIPLARALTLAEPEGYCRIFLDAGRPLFSLIQDAGRQGVLPFYTGQLLQADGRRGGNSEPAGLLEPLTGREQEILRLIAQGCSNQQIASALVLSVGTVKGHVNHIFGKLDVQNRTEAVARSRELGLL
jgi:LuxR family maltose regulon positive regulatory protein